MLGNKNSADTIVALITPNGRGAIGVIRVSGPETIDISKAILGLLPQPRLATHLPFFDRNKALIDKGIAIYFPGPNSFTGEDVLELHGHGGPVVLDYLLQQILSFNARMARPGEFSERAFLNGKIDLTQAEAVADLINANSLQAARSAIRSMQGEFSQSVQKIISELIQLRMYIEASIDFPDEELEFLQAGMIKEKLHHLLIQVEKSFHNAKQGALLRDGITVVIVGAPNVGKSSLLNRLTGLDCAIVSDVPGTTRDILREPIHIDGPAIHLIDTAGLRTSDDPIEQEGIRRTHIEMEKADVLLLITDVSNNADENDLRKLIAQQCPLFPDKVNIIANKIDLINKEASIEQLDDHPVIYLSARTGEGIPLLLQHLKSLVGYNLTQEGTFIARRRHLDALERAKNYLQQAHSQIESPQIDSELLAEELRLAQNTLSEITGEFRPDDLLGEIFSNFCIGK